jgi:hypothetical protein
LLTEPGIVGVPGGVLAVHPNHRTHGTTSHHFTLPEYGHDRKAMQ